MKSLKLWKENNYSVLKRQRKLKYVRHVQHGDSGILYAKQKHPGCKKSARPIRSSIANRYVRPKTLISVEAKKLLIKNLLE